jgi:hypothetical protein
MLMTNRSMSNDDLAHSLNKHLTLNTFDLERDADDEVHFLDSGAYGDAYSNSHGHVLKITEAMTEALYAIRLMNSNTSEHCIKIHGVFITDSSNQQIVIVQEQLNTDSLLVQKAQSILSTINGQYLATDYEDFIENYLDVNCLEQLEDDETNQILSDLYISFTQYELAGCFPNDLHGGNIGSKIIDGVERIIIFDQMGDPDFERSMTIAVENEDNLQNAFKEYLTPTEFSQLTVVNEKMLTDYLYIAELTEAIDDLTYALSTEEAYKHLVGGDWVAGGCYAFSQLFLQEWDGLRAHYDMQSITSEPKIITVTSTGAGRSSAVYEHTAVQIGSLIVDASGIHGMDKFIDNFVTENVPRPLAGTQYQVEYISKELLDNSEISHVDMVALSDTLSNSHVMPTQLANCSSNESRLNS